MTIKERKQITGTTAQIDAYEGHEGQIVWDKDKKTLVGMSGTAGENYPLASQAYVDTQFLPLTGGNITGKFLVNSFGSLAKQDVPGYEELMLQVYDRANQWAGGLLTLRGHSGSVEEERGSFLLAARNKDGTSSGMLLGTPSGKLLWSNNEVLCITGSGPGWVRFNPNIQICFGNSVTTSENFVTVAYGAPFSQNPSVTTTVIGDSYNAGVTYTCLVSTSTTSFRTTPFENGGLAPGVVFFWIAIGYY